jgi:7-cyano-7-deazaguanine synthase in queuosine biosynthesis
VSDHRLLLSAGARQLASLAREDFLWRPVGEASSMHTTLGPRLEQLGPVADPHVDFVRLAALVYLVDRTAPRSGRGFERELSLTVPVSDPDAWGERARALADLLRLLSSDSWSLAFTSARPPRRKAVADAHSSELVLLFSGGADSLSGALVAHADGRMPLLTSHWDFSIIGGIQNRLVGELEAFWDAAPPTRKVRLGRRATQIGSGIRFRKEGSSRTRSLLFLALGLAVASVNDAELWMAENGFASLNVPLTGERRAAFSTRTTHPGFLRDLSAVLRPLGLRVRLSNPFEQLTKGEVYQRVSDTIGAADAARLLSASHSCAKPDRGPGFAADTHCGACFGCLVRRAAFLAADLPDATVYIEEQLRGHAGRDERLGRDWRATYESVRARATRGVKMADVLALGLPDDYDLDEALRVARAGVAELDRLRLP